MKEVLNEHLNLPFKRIFHLFFLSKEDISKNASTQNFFWKIKQLKFSSPRASLKSSLDVTVD